MRPVRLKPMALLSQVKHSTTELPGISNIEDLYSIKGVLGFLAVVWSCYNHEFVKHFSIS